MTLTEFLTARLDEDEAAARACHVETALPAAWERLSDGWPQASSHIARHDPARVLAEVAAKRAIVEKAHRADAAFEHQINPATSAATMALTEVLQRLAAVYSDHPDYDPAWRP